MRFSPLFSFFSPAARVLEGTKFTIYVLFNTIHTLLRTVHAQFMGSTVTLFKKNILKMGLMVLFTH